MEHQDIGANGDIAEHLECEEVNQQHWINIVAFEEFLKLSAIVCAHPRVCSDECQVAAFSEQARTPLVEEDADVTCTGKRSVAFLAVLVDYAIHLLQLDVWWITNDTIESNKATVVCQYIGEHISPFEGVLIYLLTFLYLCIHFLQICGNLVYF